MDSFANLEDWYRIALGAQEDGEGAPFSILIGNKSKHCPAYTCSYNNLPISSH